MSGRDGRPGLLLLDVNETLSDLAPLADAFREVGLPAELAQAWFASVLRDGIALAATGTTAAFADVARGQLLALLGGRSERADDGSAADLVMERMTGLAPHPDVAPGLRALAGSGVRLVTLSNGSASLAQDLLERAGVSDVVEATLSVEEAGVWKPAARSYAWALDRVGVGAEDAALAAVHPWDVHGAARAGLRGVWVDRRGAHWPGWFERPHLTVSSFRDLASRWAPSA